MDWNFWGPSHGQDAPESTYDMGYGWECDFYFGYGVDVIEEEALNEKSCIEVLRKLLSKADMEIEELQEDLEVLQNQLEWAEQNKYEEWFEICCKGLGEKAKFLEFSVESLKNEDVQNEHDNDFQSLLHEEPAKRICEIVKALLRNHCQDKDEQPEDIIVKDFKSDAFKHTTGQSNDKKSSSNIDSRTITMEKVKEASVTCIDMSNGLSSSIIVKDFRSDAFRHETCQSNDEQSLDNFDSKIITMEEVKEPTVTCIDTSISLNLCKPDGKAMDHPGTVKLQEVGVVGTGNTVSRSPLRLQGHRAKDMIKSEPMDVQEFRITPTDKTASVNLCLKLQGKMVKRKMQSNPVGAQEPCIPPTTDIGLNLPLNSRRKRRQKPDSTRTNNNVSFISPNWKKTKKVFQRIPHGAQDPDVVANNKEINSFPLLKTQAKGTKSTIPLDMGEVKDSSVTSTELLTLKGNTIGSTIEEDLQSCGAQEPSVKEPGSPPTTDFGSHLSSNLKEKREIQPIPCDSQDLDVVVNEVQTLLKPQAKRRKSIILSHVAEVKKPSVTSTEFFTLQGDTLESTSEEDLQRSKCCGAQELSAVASDGCISLHPLSEQQVKKRKSATPPYTGEIRKTSVTPEFSTLLGDRSEDIIKENLQLSMSCGAQDPSDAVNNNHIYPVSKPKAKTRKKTGKSIIPQCAGKVKEISPPELLVLQGDTIESTTEEDQNLPMSCGAAEPSVVADGNHISLYPLLKPSKMMKSTIPRKLGEVKEPSVTPESLTSQADATESTTEEDLNLSKSCHISKSHDEIVEPLPLTYDDLKVLKLVSLKALAKKRRLRGYSQLPKNKLIKLLMAESM